MSFGLPSTDLITRRGREVGHEERQNSQQEMVWVERWTTVVSMTPALLADLSCKLSIRESTMLDGRGSRFTICITSSSSGDKDRLTNGPLFMNQGGRTEGRILFRTRASTLNDMQEDALVRILLPFMLGNSVTRGPGVDFRWCPLTQRIGLTSCAVTGVTLRRSSFNLTRREVFLGHQRRGQTEWSLNNRKDPTLQRMIKVLSRVTKGSDLLSFLKDRKWGTPGDRRRKHPWDLLRVYQRELHSWGPERSETVSQVERKEPLDREVDEKMVEEATAPPTSLTGVLEGEEVSTEGEREDITDTEESKMTSLYEESEGKTSTEEEGQERSLSSEGETKSADEDEERLQGEGRSQCNTGPLFTSSLHG